MRKTDEQKTEQENDGENSETQANNNNIINKSTSLFGVVLNSFSFGYFNNNSKSDNDTNDDNQKKELSSVILKFVYNFFYFIFNLYLLIRFLYNY